MNDGCFDPTTQFFPYITKPGRYGGGEPGSVRPNDISGRQVLLLHPGGYDAGLLDLDFQQLYFLLNRHDSLTAERGIPFDQQAVDRLREIGQYPFSLESRRPWHEFDRIILYISDPLFAARVPALVRQMRSWLPQIPEITALSFNRTIPAFLTNLVDAAIMAPTYSAAVASITGVLDAESRNIVSEYVGNGVTQQIVPLISSSADMLQISLCFGPNQTDSPSEFRYDTSITRDILLGLSRTGLERVALVTPYDVEYAHLPAVVQNLSRRINLVHHHLRVPAISPQSFLDNWVTIRPRTLQPELPLIVRGGERLDDIDVGDHPIAEAGRLALSAGWQTIVLVYRFADWNAYREGLTALTSLAGYLGQRCRTFEEKRGVRISWQPAPDNLWRGPLQFDDRIVNALTAIHRGALDRLPGEVLGEEFQPLDEIVRQLLLRCSPEIADLLSDLVPATVPLEGDHRRSLLPELIQQAEDRGITLPSFGDPINRSLTETPSTVSGETEETADQATQPRDMPMVADVFGRRAKKAAATRRLAKLPLRRLRVQYAKSAKLRLYSHLDIVRMIERAIRRSNIPVAYSAGFHPRPKLSFGPPLPWGAISRAEYFDVVLSTDFEHHHESALKKHFPDGLEIVVTMALPEKVLSLFERVNTMRYRVALPALDVNWHERIASLLNRDSVIITRDSENGSRKIDLRRFINELRLLGDQSAPIVEMDIESTAQGTARPSEVLAALLPDKELDPRTLLFERVDVFIQDGARQVSPMDAR